MIKKPCSFGSYEDTGMLQKDLDVLVTLPLIKAHFS